MPVFKEPRVTPLEKVYWRAKDENRFYAMNIRQTKPTLQKGMPHSVRQSPRTLKSRSRIAEHNVLYVWLWANKFATINSSIQTVFGHGDGVWKN